MIRSQITFKQLEAFAFVVDTGTFRAAATALGTTQPNISSRIADLEAALNVVLLHRDAGSVRLTEMGAVLLEKTRDVLWAGEALLEEAGRQDLIEERLRLGVSELVACTWLQDFLRRIKAAYPAVRVELEVDLSIRIEQDLAEHKLDLAIHNGPYKSKTDGAVVLADQPYVWAAHPDLAAALGPAPDLSAVFQHPVLMHARHTSAARALHMMAKDRGLPAGQIVHSSALSACVPMVADGMGVALLPRALLRGELARGAVHALDCDWLPDPLTFEARYTPARVARFVAHAAAMALDAAAAFEDQHF